MTRGKRAGWSLLGAVLGAAPLAAVLLAFAAGPAAAAVPAKHAKAVKAATAHTAVASRSPAHHKGAKPVVAHTKAVKANVLPGRVRIAGVRVGGLAPAAAARAVRAAFSRPLVVRIDGAKIELHPPRLAKAYVKGAVGHAHVAKAGTNVRLAVAVRGAAVRSAVAHLARRFDARGRSATLSLRDGVPHLTKEVDGRSLDQRALVARIVHSLAANVRRALGVHTRLHSPTATASSLGPVVLINREQNRLFLFHGNELWRSFPVATGQAVYPTPTGRFDIVVKWVNPWWYPPTSSSWAQGLKPVPPGPDNPLGTRWMGLSAPGIGIHGTDAPSSIGYSVSHGCIRMQVPDSEWLFDHVSIGTTVFIV